MRLAYLPEGNCHLSVPSFDCMTNEEGGEGKTGGKTTQVRDLQKLCLHCLFDLGFGFFGRTAIPVIEVNLDYGSFDCITNEEGGEGETGEGETEGKATQVRDHHKLRFIYNSHKHQALEMRD